jgi:polyhydroxybutyrate depolymerase
VANSYRRLGRFGRLGLLLACLAAIKCAAGIDNPRDRQVGSLPQRLAANGGAGPPVAGELTSHELTHQGQRRTYSLYVPPSLQADQAAPLVLVFHGGHGRGDRLAQRIGLNEIARREGFVVAYPDAAGDRHWNDGRSTTESDIDDVSFTLALVEHISAQQDIDQERIYATGFSNGGSFTARLACEASDRIAAFAQVASTMSVELRATCSPDAAVSIMLINGTLDPLVPWAGGKLRKTQRLGKGGEVISADAAVDFWTTNNACDAEPRVAQLDDRDLNDGTTVRETQFGDCRNGSEVVMLAVEGGGHTWPGSPERPRLRKTVGTTSRDIDASEVIWAFFRNHSLR